MEPLQKGGGVGGSKLKSVTVLLSGVIGELSIETHKAMLSQWELQLLQKLHFSVFRTTTGLVSFVICGLGRLLLTLEAPSLYTQEGKMSKLRGILENS